MFAVSVSMLHWNVTGRQFGGDDEPLSDLQKLALAKVASTCDWLDQVGICSQQETEHGMQGRTCGGIRNRRVQQL